jgi:chromosome segregation protein
MEHLGQEIEKFEGTKTRLEQTITNLQETLKNDQSTKDELSAAAFNLRISLATHKQKHDHLEQERERVQRSYNIAIAQLAEIQAQLPAAVERYNSLTNEQGNDESFMLYGTHSRAELDEKLTGLRKNKDKYTELITTYEKDGRANLKILNELRNKHHSLEIEVTRLNTELNELFNQLTTVFEMNLDEVAAIGPIDKNEEIKLQDLISSEKAYLLGLGEVNPLAEDEYVSVKERYTFLTSQRDDLIEAQVSLKKIIEETQESAKRKFIETFDRIQTEFVQVFSKLFQGGTASLSLSDPSDILGSGIDIQVQPPGKKAQNLSLIRWGTCTGSHRSFVCDLKG